MFQALCQNVSQALIWLTAPLTLPPHLLSFASLVVVKYALVLLCFYRLRLDTLELKACPKVPGRGGGRMLDRGSRWRPGGKAGGAGPGSFPRPNGFSGPRSSPRLPAPYPRTRPLQWPPWLLNTRTRARARKPTHTHTHTQPGTKIPSVSHIIRPGKTKTAVGPRSSSNRRRRFNCRQLSLSPFHFLAPSFIFSTLQMPTHFSLVRRAGSNYWLCLQGLFCQSLNEDGVNRAKSVELYWSCLFQVEGGK